jgi:hypothetical protein
MLHGLLVALLLSAGPGDNVQLLADPTFARIAQLLAQPPADLDIVERQRLWPWIAHEIELPATAAFAPPAVTLTGGVVFLHSAAFDVEPGQAIEVRFHARGSGQVTAGFTWWQINNDEVARRADPHLTLMPEPVQPGDGRVVTFQATVPASARRAYLRIVVRQGEVVVSDPIVRPIQP